MKVSSAGNKNDGLRAFKFALLVVFPLPLLPPPMGWAPSLFCSCRKVMRKDTPKGDCDFPLSGLSP